MLYGEKICPKNIKRHYFIFFITTDIEDYKETYRKIKSLLNCNFPVFNFLTILKEFRRVPEDFP